MRLRDEIGAHVAPVDAAVATLGRFVAAPAVLAATSADLTLAVEGYLLAHFVVARTLIPVLREHGSSYTLGGRPVNRPDIAAEWHRCSAAFC